MHRTSVVWKIAKYRRDKRLASGTLDHLPTQANNADTEPLGFLEDSASSSSSPHAIDAVRTAQSHSPPGKDCDRPHAHLVTNSPHEHVTKNKQHLLEHSGSHMDTNDASRRHLFLSDMLSALGDGTSAFPIYFSLCRSTSTGLPLAHLIACACAAQTQGHAIQARTLLDDYVDEILDHAGRGSSAELLFKLLAARAWDWPGDEDNANGQIDELIIACTESLPDNELQLKALPPRDNSLDIPLYQHLGYALGRWNDSNASNMGVDKIDVDRLLCQMVSQQLASEDDPGSAVIDPSLRMGCLPSCLKWCLDVLAQNPVIPNALLGRAGSPVDALTAIYQVSCTLWGIWLSYILPSSSSVRFPPEISAQAGRCPHASWADESETQLGISAAELLVTVVCMIMAEAWTATTTMDPCAAGSDIILHAQQGASVLVSLAPGEILDRFLRQVRQNSDPRMLAPTKVAVEVIPAIFRPFRDFVFTCLGLPVSAPDPDAPVHPLVLAIGV